MVHSLTPHGTSQYKNHSVQLHIKMVLPQPTWAVTLFFLIVLVDISSMNTPTGQIATVVFPQK